MTMTEPSTGTPPWVPHPTPNPGGPPPWVPTNPPNLTPTRPGTPAPRSTVNRLQGTPPPNNDAQAGLVTYLSQFGLQSLAGWAWNEYVRLGGGQSAMDQIALELPRQQAFQQRFPAIALRQKAGLPQLTPADYLSYEASLDQELALVGAPAAIRAGTNQFNSIVSSALAGDVSISEMQQRIEGGYQAVRDADPSVRNWFGEKFGVQGDNALAAYFLAPEHSEATLARMEREAEVGGSAQRVAGIDLSTDTASRIAATNPSSNVDAAFAHITALAPLFSERTSESTNLSAAVQGVAAQFNLDPESSLELQRRLDERNASMSGRGIATEDATGITGTGVAR